MPLISVNGRPMIAYEGSITPAILLSAPAALLATALGGIALTRLRRT
jgi:hypothetical protein